MSNRLKPIILDQTEQYIVKILNEVCQLMPNHPQAFIVGGWVRDKLLGQESHDIDVMVYKVTGPEFAKAVTQHLGLHDPHIIKSNPDKSKHIETATVNLPVQSGEIMKIDFAMCRTEVYNDGGSRRPSEVKAATPEEDAFRRDSTVGSLFYDITSGTVLDYTKQGLNDLKEGVLRAPGSPLQSFLDDPLRLIRFARFAARFGWKIAPETWDAMKNPLILDALEQKTSKERIGEELAVKGILKEKHADYGIQLLKDSGILERLLYQSLKGTPYEGQMKPWDMNQDNPHHALSLWGHTMQVLQHAMTQYPNPSEKRVLMLLVALFHDVGKMFSGSQQTSAKGYTSYRGHEEHSQEITNLLLRHLRLDNDVVYYVSSVAGKHMLPFGFLDGANAKTLRRFVRELGKIGIDWVDVMNQATSDVAGHGTHTINERLVEMQNLRNKIQAVMQETPQVQQIKPLLDGRELMTAFNRQDGGHWIKDIQNFLDDLRDENPNLTKVDGLVRAQQQFPQFIRQITTAAKHSQIAIANLQQQINQLVESRPQEALSVATKFWEKQPDDERGLILCLETVLASKIKTGQNLMSAKLCDAAQKLAENRFFNPQISLLYLSCKMLTSNDLDKTDLAILGRANRMDPRITKERLIQLRSQF